MSAGRQYLTDRQWREMLDAQGGVCAIKDCGSTGPFHADHSTPNAFAPGKPDQLICVPCHKAKTRSDVRNIAKAKRLSGETGSQPLRRAEREAKGLRPNFPKRPMSRKPRARSASEIMGDQNG